MQRFSTGIDGSFYEEEPHVVDDAPHPLTTALLTFETCRSHMAQATGFTQRPRISEPIVLAREPAMWDEIAQIHDALPENEQLRIYRFFLTAVHRNSVLATRFDPAVISSIERLASVEAEFDDISAELEETIAAVAARNLDMDPVGARLLAADFLWTTTWWMHARTDVISFVYDRMEDPFVVLLLGRAPDPVERVSRDIYQQAALAEIDYRSHVSSRVGGQHEAHPRPIVLPKDEYHL